jgi:hypothetical protein
MEPSAPIGHISATVPPFASHAFADFSGSHPWPLQEFMPLHELLAVLQALMPLHELIPAQCVDLPAFFANAGLVAAPLIARAMAAAASDAPETIFVFMQIS